MLAACIEDGLTVGNQVYKKGDIFVLEGETFLDIESVSDERLARKQIRMYKRPMFRRATPEEIIQAVLYKPKPIPTEKLTANEKAMVARYARGRKEQEAKARSFLVEEKEKLEKEDEFIDEVVDENTVDSVEDEDTKELPIPQEEETPKPAPKKPAPRKKSTSSRKKTTK